MIHGTLIKFIINHRAPTSRENGNYLRKKVSNIQCPKIKDNISFVHTKVLPLTVHQI